MGLRSFALFDAVQRNARLYADRTAFIFDDERITHGAYLARAERLAAGLARAGIVCGDRILVLAQNNLEFVDLYGAAARLGAILVPVNWRLSAEEVAYIAADAAPKLVIAESGLQGLLQGREQALPSVTHWSASAAAARRMRLTRSCSRRRPPARRCRKPTATTARGW